MEPGEGLVTLVAEGAEPSSQDRTPGACSDGGRLSDADVEQRNMVKFAFETAAVDEGGAGQTPEERTENYLVVKAQRQRDQRARAAARAYFAAQADQRASASGGVGARQAVVEVVSRQQRIRKLYREQRIRQRRAPKASSGRPLSRKVRVPPTKTTIERKRRQKKTRPARSSRRLTRMVTGCSTSASSSRALPCISSRGGRASVRGSMERNFGCVSTRNTEGYPAGYSLLSYPGIKCGWVPT